MWLKQELPPFTTRHSAILPFEVDPRGYVQDSDNTWTTVTTMYSTELACKPATVMNTTYGTKYVDDNGCEVSLDLPSDTNPTALYIGWHMDQAINYALSEMGCSSEQYSHNFMAYYSNNAASIVLFCKPSYWMEQVNATVTAPNMSVSDIIQLGSPEPLADSMFNVSNLEYILGTDAVSKSGRADISDTTIAVDQKSRLRDIGITGNGTDGNMVGFALGTTGLDPNMYLDSKTLASVFEKAHQLLFALAIGTLFSANSSNPNPRPAIVQSPTNAVTVVRVLAILVECFLGLVGVFTLALCCTSWIRPSQLGRDPDSLTAIMDMASPDLSQSASSNARVVTRDKIQASIKRGSLNVSAGSECGENHNLRSSRRENLSTSDLVRILGGNSHAVRPFELRFSAATVFITLLLLVVVTFIVLQVKVRKGHGLPLPSNSPTINQLLTNYLPVIFATLLEPFWLLLNRVLCILRPFEELRKGHAKPSESLDLRYTSLPPQLVVWRAIRAHHFLLAAICAAGLSANVLSVALSGLFQVNMIPITLNAIFKALYLPAFGNITSPSSSGLIVADPTLATVNGPKLGGIFGADAAYVAKANISDGTALPPWLSQDRFFLPFAGANTSFDAEDTTKLYKATTQGYGARLRCVPVTYDPTIFIYNGNGTLVPAPVIIPRELSQAQDTITCDNLSQGPVGGQNASNAAAEVMLPLSASNPKTNGICSKLLLFGMLRANLTVSSDYIKTNNPDVPNPEVLEISSLSSFWMVCQPTLLTAPYSITIDGSGRVQRQSQIGPYTPNPDHYFSSSSDLPSLFRQTGPGWRSSYLAQRHFR